jgi:hypothetical protein
LVGIGEKKAAQKFHKKQNAMHSIVRKPNSGIAVFPRSVVELVSNRQLHAMEVTASLLKNGEDVKPQGDIYNVIVKSSDGKLHDCTYNTASRKLNFALIE